ncbi:hypothetical protein M5689_022578 [Euphorbia peplus]|nr:hypothetical protein M5689_022578 [Euphorbia peplus]
MEKAESNPSEEPNPTVSPDENHKNDIEIEVIIIPNNEKLSLQERTTKSPKLLKSNASLKSCSIFRVPQNILNLHPRSFQPELVSIGPYYHGEQRLQMMEEHKCRILGVFLGVVQDNGVVIDDLYKAIEKNEEDIRGCYSQDTKKFNSKELVEMMILDGCFILYLLCVQGTILVPEAEDPIFNMPCMEYLITRDLLMLENQIPFFVLQILYDTSLSNHFDVAPLQEHILKLIHCSLPRCDQVSELCDRYTDFSGQHILDFYRSTYIPPKIEDGSNGHKKMTWWRWRGSSSTQLEPKEDSSTERDSLLSAPRNSGISVRKSLRSSLSKLEQGDSKELLSENEEAEDKEKTTNGGVPLRSLSKKDSATERNSGRSVRKSLRSSLSKHEEATTEQGDSEENEESEDVPKEPPRGGWGMKLCGLMEVSLKGKEKSKEELLQFLQPVEKLLQAGIKFKKRDDTDSFLDIDFIHRTLWIPRLVTGETMSTLILNCIAFEQCYKHTTKHFTSYFNFMGYLLNTTYDAAYLREKKIIANFFGTDEELVKFFNDVGKNIPYYFKEDYLENMAKKVEKYYRNAWHVRYAEFKYTYCGSVWVCLSASAALLVVFLTALQSFYAVFAYHNPSG